MGMLPRDIGDWLERWLYRRTLPGLLAERLASEPPCDGSLVEVVQRNLDVADGVAQMDADLDWWRQVDDGTP